MSDDIGKLADEVIGRMKTTEELKHVPFEMYARILNRAVKAEAERDVLREARWWMSWDSAPKDGRWIVAVCNDMVTLLRVSWGNNREGHLAWCSNTSSYGDGDGLFAGWIDCPTKVFGARATLAPSTAGREG